MLLPQKPPKKVASEESRVPITVSYSFLAASFIFFLWAKAWGSRALVGTGQLEDVQGVATAPQQRLCLALPMVPNEERDWMTLLRVIAQGS